MKVAGIAIGDCCANTDVKRRNGEIDLMRVLMALVIVVYHAPYVWGQRDYAFSHGACAVDFFFILSGLLMAKSIASGRIGDSFAFLKRKISSFYLVFFVSVLISGIVFCISHHLSPSESAGHFLSGVFEFLLIGQGGLQPFTGFNAVSWYLSAMIMAMAILHPVASRFRKWFFPIGAVFVAACCYGALYHNYGRIVGGRGWTGFCSYRMVRAFAGISLGVFVFDMADRTSKAVETSKAGCWLFNLVKMFTIAMFFAIMFHPCHGVIAHLGNMDGFVCVLFFAAYLYLTFSGLAEIEWLRKIPLGWCGSASLYIFLNHRSVLYVLNRNFIQKNGMPAWECFTLLFLGTIASCLLCATLVALLRRIGRTISPLLLVQKDGDAAIRIMAKQEKEEVQ